MRILGFSTIAWENFESHSPKMFNPTFTTFRLPRLDRDYELDEELQVVLKPRSKDRVALGIAKVVGIDRLPHGMGITDKEARQDGFINSNRLKHYLGMERMSHPKKRGVYPYIYIKVTLAWVIWYPPMIRSCTLGIFALMRKELSGELS